MIRSLVCRECGQVDIAVKGDRCFKTVSGAHDWIDFHPPKQTLREQVAEFHAAMDMKDPATPTIPSDDRVRLRAKLIAEEFFEVMEAMFSRAERNNIEDLHSKMLGIIKDGWVQVDMPELADGMGDLDYVVEGTRLEFGIDGEPIAAEIHRTNMAKFIGEPVWSEPASPGGARKRLKPVGWTPPDITGELRKQGWKP